MDRVHKVDIPRVICEDCGASKPATEMFKLASAWLCRGCWRIDTKTNNDTQEAGK